jgi:hypothetical protein
MNLLSSLIYGGAAIPSSGRAEKPNCMMPFPWLVVPTPHATSLMRHLLPGDIKSCGGWKYSPEELLRFTELTTGVN